MKIQIENQTMRFRVSESELARLLKGEVIVDQTLLPGGTELTRSLTLQEAGSPQLVILPNRWVLTLPKAPVEILAASLPSRGGAVFQLETPDEPLKLQFDVDIHDSARQRGAAARKR